MCIWNGNEDVPSKSASLATDVVPGVAALPRSHGFRLCWALSAAENLLMGPE